MTEKRFKVHIIWYNYEKTKGEIELKDRGQPILVSDRIDDVQWIKRLLNELNDENKQLKQQVINWIDNKIKEIKPYNSELCRATLLELRKELEND